MLALVSQVFEMQILNKWPPGPQHESPARVYFIIIIFFFLHFGKTKHPLLFIETVTLLTSATRGKQFKVQ